MLVRSFCAQYYTARLARTRFSDTIPARRIRFRTITQGQPALKRTHRALPYRWREKLGSHRKKKVLLASHPAERKQRYKKRKEGSFIFPLPKTDIYFPSTAAYRNHNNTRGEKKTVTEAYLAPLFQWWVIRTKSSRRTHAPPITIPGAREVAGRGKSPSKQEGRESICACGCTPSEYI